jgi:hypothetical protein
MEYVSNNVVLKIAAELLQLDKLYFVCPIEYLINKSPVPTKRATISLIKVKSRNSLLRMLLACVRSYIKPVLRYKLLIFLTLSSGHSILP